MSRHQLRKVLLLVLKLGVSLAILTYLVYQLFDDEGGIDALRDQPKNWKLLLAALGVNFAAVVLTFLRWCVLVRALGLPFTVKDSLRLGFLGYLLNFVSLGSVGGDLFKAVFIAREQHGRRTEAVATVIVDRLIGLYALFLVTSGALMFGDLMDLEHLAELRAISYTCTAAGAVGLAMLTVPAVTGRNVMRFFARWPLVGGTAVRLLQAARIYRERFGAVILTIVMSIAVHSLLTLGFYLLSIGLPGGSPTLAEHFVIVPLSMLAGVVPLPFNAAGAFDFMVDVLYRRLSSVTGLAERKGFIVALGYRAITILIAIAGLFYWLGSRREVAAAWHQAEEEAERES